MQVIRAWPLIPFAWDGCKDTGIAMSFDASNKEIPFKGQSSRCSYEFNAR